MVLDDAASATLSTHTGPHSDTNYSVLTFAILTYQCAKSNRQFLVIEPKCSLDEKWEKMENPYCFYLFISFYIFIPFYPFYFFKYIAAKMTDIGII